jgi:5-methylcytosine-specific restriction protein A
MAGGRPTPATQVDHIRPKAKGGTDEPANLQSICDECHKAKTLADEGRTPRATIGEDGWPIA